MLDYPILQRSGIPHDKGNYDILKFLANKYHVWNNQ